MANFDALGKAPHEDHDASTRSGSRSLKSRQQSMRPVKRPCSLCASCIARECLRLGQKACVDQSTPCLVLSCHGAGKAVAG